MYSTQDTGMRTAREKKVEEADTRIMNNSKTVERNMEERKVVTKWREKAKYKDKLAVIIFTCNKKYCITESNLHCTKNNS